VWKLKGKTTEVFKERVIKDDTWKEKYDMNNVDVDGNMHSKSDLTGVEQPKGVKTRLKILGGRTRKYKSYQGQERMLQTSIP
jgi:nitrate reductase alpha subunit